jgi:hypothetical protein
MIPVAGNCRHDKGCSTPVSPLLAASSNTGTVVNRDAADAVHLIDTTARPCAPQPQHRARSLSSSALLRGLRPQLELFDAKQKIDKTSIY